MRHLVVGGGGILGSGFRATLARQQQDATWLHVAWDTPGAVATALATELPAQLRDDEPATVVWAAGVGHIGASKASLDAETAGVQALCDSIRRLPDARRSQVAVLFASSAGALFGGHGSAVVDDDSPPSPITAYGEVKLEQERLLGGLAQDTGCRVVVCRISNLYGLAQDQLTPRGLVATAVRATRTRQPMTIYVSPDTRRDHIYSLDAAAVSLHHLQRAPAGLTTVLVRDGSTRTVAEVLSLIRVVCGRRVPASYAERPETRLQPRVLRFSRPPQGPDEVRRTPMEAVVHRMLRAPMTA